MKEKTEQKIEKKEETKVEKKEEKKEQKEEGKRILIVSQGVTFLINSLESRLKKEGLVLHRCEPSFDEIDAHIPANPEDLQMILLFAGELKGPSQGVPAYVAGKCEELEVPFCMVGYPDELGKLEKNVNITSISAEFSRPFDLQTVASQIAELARAKDAAIEELPSVSRESLSPAGKHRILLCDDDIMFLKMVQGWLGDRYQVTAVKTGMMALSIAEKTEPELLLLDYEMPVMSGPEVLEALRKGKKTAELPVVFLTGHADRTRVMNAMNLRPQGYLLKSTGREDLIAMIEHFFATGQWKQEGDEES